MVRWRPRCKHLRQLILDADDDLNLWALYAEIAVDREDLRYALQNILRLNPGDESAAARLHQLGGDIDDAPARHPGICPQYAR